MDHQVSQPDCQVWIKEELGDDSAQTVENQSTDECDRKELDLPCINITPIDSNQMEICKTEDSPKVELEPNDMCYPLSESSERASVRCENASSGDCLETTKEHPPRTNRVQTDDGFDQLVEVPGEIDQKGGQCSNMPEVRILVSTFAACIGVDGNVNEDNKVFTVGILIHLYVTSTLKIHVERLREISQKAISLWEREGEVDVAEVKVLPLLRRRYDQYKQKTAQLNAKSCRMWDYLRLTIEPPRHGDIPRLGSRRPTLVRHIPPPETKRLKTDCDKCFLSRETKLKAIEEQKKTLRELRETQSKVLQLQRDLLMTKAGLAISKCRAKLQRKREADQRKRQVQQRATKRKLSKT